MKKLINYYRQVGKKYGLVYPIIAVAVLFAVVCLFEFLNLFSKLLDSSAPVFYTLFVIGLVALLVAIALIFFKGRSKNINILDACITWIAVLALAVLILFLFNASATFIGITKIVISVVVLLAVLSGAVSRSELVEC